ncbi:uncharacterized [Tachysurus ichikawai]
MDSFDIIRTIVTLNRLRSRPAKKAHCDGVELVGVIYIAKGSNAGGSYLGGKACWLAYGFHGEPVGQSDCVKQMLGKRGRKNKVLRQGWLLPCTNGGNELCFTAHPTQVSTTAASAALDCR